MCIFFLKTIFADLGKRDFDEYKQELKKRE